MREEDAEKHKEHFHQELEAIVIQLKGDHKRRQDAIKHQLQSHKRKIKRLKERIRRYEMCYEPNPDVLS
jgi:archaellum component FlaC